MGSSSRIVDLDDEGVSFGRGEGYGLHGPMLWLEERKLHVDLRGDAPRFGCLGE